MNLSGLQINLLAALSCFLWSTAFVGVKIGLEYSSPIQFAGIRFIIAGLMLLPFIKPSKKLFRKLYNHRSFVLKIALFQTFFQYLFFYMGLSRVPGALSAILIGASPVIISVMSHFMMPNDKMTPAKTLAILLGFAGVILVALARPVYISNSSSYYIGIGFLLLTNTNSGYTNIFIAKHKHDLPSMALTSISLFIGGIMLFLVSLIWEPFSFEIYPFPYYYALLWLSFLSAAAISIWMFLLKQPNIIISDMNIWKFIIPVSGAILSWIILTNESPSVVAVSGMIVTGIALILLNIRFFKKNR